MTFGLVGTYSTPQSDVAFPQPLVRAVRDFARDVGKDLLLYVSGRVLGLRV